MEKDLKKQKINKMTEGEFLQDWVNDVTNEYDEKDHHEYSEREVMDMLRKWGEFKVHHLVNGQCSTCRRYEQEQENTMFEPPELYLNVCNCEVEQCKMIKGKCKNLAYR